MAHAMLTQIDGTAAECDCDPGTRYSMEGAVEGEA